MLWFREVMDRTISVIVEWLRVGFVHGVMNTDNMSILGLTIDYGPFSFLDEYDPSFTPNTTDLPGRRYAFGRQYLIGFWNLRCLAGAISPLVKDTDKLAAQLEAYEDVYLKKYNAMMADKLGLDVVREEDISLFTRLEKMLSTVKPDMTIFYQLLMGLPLNLENEAAILDHFNDCFYSELKREEIDSFYSIIRAYQERSKTNTCTREDSLSRMRKSNPRFILRKLIFTSFSA